jgi:transcriptional regulator with XRE-family HTH domain
MYPSTDVVIPAMTLLMNRSSLSGALLRLLSVRLRSATGLIGLSGFAEGRTSDRAVNDTRPYIGKVSTDSHAQVIALRPVERPVATPRPAAVPPRPAPRSAAPVKEPLWRHVVGDVLRRERLAQERTLRDVSEAAQISMPYLSELERGRKEASSEILAAAARALGLNLADLLARAHQVLAQAELARTTPRQLTSDRRLSSGGSLSDADAERAVTSLGELATRHTSASGASQGSVSLAA